jgi:hypothetical protein
MSVERARISALSSFAHILRGLEANAIRSRASRLAALLDDEDLQGRIRA